MHKTIVRTSQSTACIPIKQNNGNLVSTWKLKSKMCSLKLFICNYVCGSYWRCSIGKCGRLSQSNHTYLTYLLSDAAAAAAAAFIIIIIIII